MPPHRSGLVLSVWWMYSLYFVVDKNMSFSDAFGASKNIVTTSGFFNNLGLLVIVGILNSLGSSVVLGTLVTMPFGMLLMANAYLELSGERRRRDSALKRGDGYRHNVVG